MAKYYSEFAGRSLERLAALSDGIFAFSMTLLLLDLHTPLKEAIHSEQDLAAGLVKLYPSVVTWLMSMMTLGIFWVGQQTQLGHLKSSNRNYTWLSLALLASVTAIPFTTKILREFIDYRIALLAYWVNILMIGMFILICWIKACHWKLLKPEVTTEIYRAVARRVLIAQSLYAIGASLCFFHPYWSIGFIVAVQLNYVFAPRIPLLYELTA